MIHRIIATGLVLASVAGPALASDGRNAGSLLLYPEFDNRHGTVTVLTVTNVDVDETSNPIEVEFVYIGKYSQSGHDIGCLEFNRTEVLTPADTITLITNFHNPEQEQGYVYAFAKDPSSHVAVTHNYLTGNVMTVEGLEAFEYSVNPVSYRGHTNPGTATDLDGDGILDMSGCEYTGNPAEILIPRFLGQGGMFNSELIMIGLTGGTAFDTTLDFLIFNDNEEIFSSEHTFHCWERRHLLEISGIFHNAFLADWTNDDPLEMLGAPYIETGWIHIEGALANSSNTTIFDPAVYCVLVERIDGRGAADLPFEKGLRINGELLPHDPFGDPGTDVVCN
ncbi:MAG: hypothetical protein H6828_12335 [Planctomycetes bacterium]|nr:hypothetical protein [Planctomycetota bacterium]